MANHTQTGSIELSSTNAVKLAAEAGWKSDLGSYYKKSEIDTTVNGITTRVSATESSISGHPDCWRIDRYSLPARVNTNKVVPVPDDFVEENFLDTRYRKESDMGTNLQIADYYIAKLTTYVHATEATTITDSFQHDDASAVYLNDEHIAEAAGTTVISVTLNLRAGWNKIRFLLNEHGGSDYARFATRISTWENVDQQVADLNEYEGTIQNQRLKTAETSIEQNAEAITLRATKAEFNALSIGGRNLLPYSKPSAENLPKVSTAIASNAFAIEDGFDCYKGTGSGTNSAFYASNGKHIVVLEADTQYIYSAWVKLTTTTSATSVPLSFSSLGHFTVRNSNSSKSDQTHEDVAAERVYSPSTVTIGQWTKITITFTTNELAGSTFGVYAKYNYGTEYTLFIRDMKLEKGNRATDWTPAPEDMATQTDLNTAKAEIKVTTDGINSEVSKISSAKYVNARATSWTLADLRTYASEGHQENWNVQSTDGLRVGDVVYVKGTDGTRNVPIYVKTTVKSVQNATNFTGISHGMEDILPVDSAISSINQSAESVKIQASRVEIDGTAVFKAANSIPDTRGTNQNPQWYFTNYPKQSVTEFKQSSVMGLSGEMYCYVTTVTGWADSSGGYPKQTAQVGSKTYWRVGTSNTAWGAWQETESTSGAQSKATAAVDNLEIGGRNLLGNTENRSGSVITANSDVSSTFGTIGNYNDAPSWYSLVNYDGYSNAVSCATSTNTGNRGVGWYTKAGEILAGETYTFSCRIKCSIATNVHMHTAWRNGSATAGYIGWTAAGTTAISADTWTDYSLTFVPYRDAKLDWEFFVAICITGSSSGATYQVAHAKLEKGNKTTDWSPAPEDVDARINAVKVGSRNLFLNSGRATLSGVANQNNSYNSALTISETIPAGTEVTVSCQIDATDLAWGSSGKKQAGVEFNVGSSSPYQYIGAWAGAALSESSNVVKVLTGTWSGRISKTVTLKYDLPKGKTYGIYVQQLGSGTCVVSKPKLEVGNRATDWDTAPEDTVRRTQRIYYRKSVTGTPASPSSWVVSSSDGSNAWTQKHISISSTDKYIYTCEQYEMADGTLGNTSILLDDTITVIDGGKILTGTVEANALKAKSLTLGNFTDAAANSIDNSKVLVGARNLLLGTKDWSTVTRSTAGTYASDGTYNGCEVLKITTTSTTSCDTSFANKFATTNFEPDEYYTFSFWAKASAAINIWSFWYYNPNVVDHAVNQDGVESTRSDGGVQFPLSTEWRRYWITWHISTSATGYPKHIIVTRIQQSATVWLAGCMFERGNKPTDWSPAPEDVDSSILSTRQDFNDQIDPINDGIRNLTTDINGHEGRIFTAESNLEQLQYRLDNLDATTQWLSFNTTDGLTIGDSNNFYTQQKGSEMTFNQVSNGTAVNLMSLSGANGIAGPKVTVSEQINTPLLTSGTWSISLSGDIFSIDYIGS